MTKNASIVNQGHLAMLSDPLILAQAQAPTSGTSTAAFTLPVVDPGAIKGKSSRKYVSGTTATTLDIGTTLTKESPPIGTNRVNLRLAQESPGNDVLGTVVTMFAQATFGLPKNKGAGDLDAVRRALANLLLYGPDESAQTLANGDAFFARLMAGEV